MAVYTNISARAIALITKFGVVLTYSRPALSTGSASGAVTQGAATTYTLPTLILPTTNEMLTFDNSLAKGSLTTENTRHLTTATQGATYLPKPMDEVTFDSSTWLVIGSTLVAPNGENIICEMLVWRK